MRGRVRVSLPLILEVTMFASRILRRSLLVAVLLILGAPRAALSQVELIEVTPDEGTVGTVIEFELTGDLGKGKPKMWLVLADDPAKKPKKTTLKVMSVVSQGGGASTVSASFKNTKTGPGAYDLHVKPKGKGQDEAVFGAAFTLRAPEITDVTPDTVASKGTIMVTGAFFGGPKKPKVQLFGTGKPKKGKVVQATDSELMVKLPKLPGGDYSLSVQSKVGATIEANAFTVTGGGSGGPGSGTDITVLHSFDGTDGKQPHSRLLLGDDGNFYGTTWTGGLHDDGTVFRITPGGALTTLHHLDRFDGGGQCRSGLIRGPDGAFYGCATLGGPLGNGTVFRVTSTGEYSVVHAFGGAGSGGGPVGRLVLGSDGAFYGTTQVGGGLGATGTAFRLTPEGDLTTLHTFRLVGEGMEYGSSPTSELVEGAPGVFYGVTELGGGGCGLCGTIFEITSAGEITLLHTFTDGVGGFSPSGGLTFGADGKLYGMTRFTSSAGGFGTLFRISTSGVFESLHSFEPPNFVSGPEGGWLLASDGNFYGTGNVVFRMTPGLVVSDVYTFLDLIEQFGGSGAPVLPRGGLTEGPGGALYGTSLGESGPVNFGTVFKIDPK